jgi:SNF2 family DNA or RNA helicase
MWFPLFDLNIDFWSKTRKITLANVTTQGGILKIEINDNNTIFKKSIHNDFLKQYIVFHYFHSMKDPNRLIDIIDGVCYVESNNIAKNIHSPIFNLLCKYYVSKNYNSTTFSSDDSFDIRTINFIPNIKINKKIFTNVKNNMFHIKLFDYQKKSIMRMLEIENKKNMTFDFNFDINIDKETVKWDIVNEKIAEKGENMGTIMSCGGILADMMGLGKTITMLGLLHYGKTLKPNEVQTNKIYSMATLIVVPSHLAKQWSDEIKRVFKGTKNIITILNKIHHENITYEDIILADIVIVTYQFLSNIKNYGQLNYRPCTPSMFKINERDEYLARHYRSLTKNDSYKIMNCPMLEYFHFNRMVVDEGHEIMESLNCHYSGGKIINRFIYNFIKSIEASYKWYVSGTPFTTLNGLEMVMQFLGVKLEYNNMVHNIKHLNKRPSYYEEEHTGNTDFPALNNYSVLVKILGCMTIRHLQNDVNEDAKLLGYKENIEWVDMTEGEKRIYEAKANDGTDRRTLLQICCHPLISQEFKDIVGNMESLEDVEEELIKHHKNVITETENKIKKLDKSNQAYHMILSKYNKMISESKYMLGILDRIQQNVEFNEDNNCIVCFDNMTDPVLTHCGHMFCKDCIMRCIDIKPECPLCKSNVTGDKLLLLNKVEKKEEIVNPLVAKYGAKLGKLIQMVRTLLSQNARIIIFSQWDDMLTLIKRSMGENGVVCSFIAGNAYQRNKAIARFKIGADNNVLLLSLNKSASGTNLTEATHIFFVEPIDETKENIMAIESQAIARAVRLGQKQQVEIVRILCKDTIEEEIYNCKYNS